MAASMLMMEEEPEKEGQCKAKRTIRATIIPMQSPKKIDAADLQGTQPVTFRYF